MARSLQSTKLVLEGVFAAISRRGYMAVAAAQGGAASSRATTGGVAIAKRAGEEKARSIEKVSWGPDPKTGYYRPGGAAAKIDVAELRAALLKHSH